jgi:hypothetical protein
MERAMKFEFIINLKANAFAIANEVFTDTGARIAVISSLPSATEGRTARFERGCATLAKTSGRLRRRGRQ